jgi:hypothetical protein
LLIAVILLSDFYRRTPPLAVAGANSSSIAPRTVTTTATTPPAIKPAPKETAAVPRYSSSPAIPKRPVKRVKIVAPAPEVVKSNLKIVFEHNLPSATLSLWVDGAAALTMPVQGTASKRMVVFRGVHGTQTSAVFVPAGTHKLWIEVQSSSGYNESKSLTENFEPDGERTLFIRCDRHSQKLVAALQ